ncbi:MAG: tetratricopeptide repeat protein [Lacunisphaera sp.]
MSRAITFVSALFLFVLFAGCVTPPSGPRIDNLPMYGQPAIPRPDFLKKADADFIAKASSGFGDDRRVASKAWTQQASRFLAQRNLDYAMRRLNQAWLLDDTNYEVYWGFGRVMVESDHFDDGVRYTKQAIELCRDEVQLPAVYSDLGVAYSYLADSTSQEHSSERVGAFRAANEAFATSVGLDPKYANAWRRWSISLTMEGKYSEAEEKAKRAKDLGAQPFPPKILKQIENGIDIGK